jgi:diadenosine tetraphosphate (Ap4A) HIT family hydrolase
MQHIARHLTGNLTFTKELQTIVALKQSNPRNLAMKHFNQTLFQQLPLAQQQKLISIVRTGFENPDSGLGCYAMTSTDYEDFNGFFDPVIREYHGAVASAVHVTDWDASDLGDDGVLDVTKLGLPELSMRVRVGRNLTQFNLPGSMDQTERILFEKTIIKALGKLVDNPEYGGNIYSLSPDHGDGPNPNLISDAKYNELVQAHVMFKDMDADPYLKSAGIASDWPYGRGCWQSADKQCIVWFGEEDQLRIMCMKKGTMLDEVFNRLKTMLDTFESMDGIDFARSDTYGYITSCPSNLGTGMRASVHIKVPHLTADGQADPHGHSPACTAICGPLGLSVRGTGGEHTPIGRDGTIDLSPRARLFIKEKEIIQALYTGIQCLMVAERAAAATGMAGNTLSVFKSIPVDNILYQGQFFFIVKDLYPVSPGHLLIISNVEKTDYFSLSIEEKSKLPHMIEIAKMLIEKTHSPDGWNIGMNCGRAAGQTVMHFHCHVVPRYDGDVDDPRGGVRHCRPGFGYY